MEATTANRQLMVKMVVAEWEKQNNNFSKLVSSLNDGQLSREVSPGRNTGIYLVGHLVAISDAMLPLLGFGEKLFPQLDNIFISHPDKSGLQKPTIGELRECLKKVTAKLSDHILSTSDEEWFQRHMAISEADFKNEPHRNKLNIIINRSNHMSYHLGQLALLK